MIKIHKLTLSAFGRTYKKNIYIYIYTYTRICVYVQKFCVESF